MQDNSIKKFQSLPRVVTDTIDSVEVIYYLVDFRDRYGIDEDHREDFLRLIRRIFVKDVAVTDIQEVLKTDFGMDDTKAHEATKEFIINLCAPFPDVFGDLTRMINDLGGSVDEVASSPAVRYMTDAFMEYAQEIADSIKPEEIESEARAFEGIFSKDIVRILRESHDMVKYKLDQSLYRCLTNIDDFNQKLVDLLLSNTENVTKGALLVDGKQASSYPGNWIKDYLGFSDHELSSINIAKYLGTSPNAVSLSSEEKNLVRHLLELYSILKDFPESFGKMSVDDWHIIFYDMEAVKKQLQEEQKEEESMKKDQEAKDEEFDTDESVTPMPKPVRSSIMIDYDVLADAAIKTLAVQIPTPELTRLTKDILTKRIRDIRDSIETREFLMESYEKAGEVLDQKVAIMLVKEASKYADMIAQGNVPDFAIAKPSTPDPAIDVVVAPTEDKPSVTSTARGQTSQNSPIGTRSRTKQHPHFGVSERATQSGIQNTSAEQAKTRLAIEDVEGVPMIVEKGANLPMTVPQSSTPVSSASIPAKPAVLKPRQQSQPREIVVRQGGNPSPYKVPLMDVKVAPRLMNPVDELRAFTLRDFRRLSNDPQSATKRIYQKIKLLEKDSASKKVAGIDAWKQSEVHSLYSMIGQESFGAGKGIAEIIASRKSQNKPVLSEPEFDALMELNEMLRF